MDAALAKLKGGQMSQYMSDGRGLLALYAGTIFLSAALLFSVQPMFARMVLPALGGAPSVWAVSMCFFQAVLLAGYCYSHLLNRFVGLRRGLLIHAGVLAIAALALPIALPEAARAAPTGNTYFWLIGILTAGVALPFFAVSANAPLLQSWFARSGHPHAADPYFLYGASNIGSLLALVAYPLLIEPSLGLSAQGGLWTAGFVMLALAIVTCGVVVAMGPAGSASDAASSDVALADGQSLPAATGWQERATWIALSFVPSALLTAYSTVLSTDIASAPLLWVMPLALFLLTFVMVFRDWPTIRHEALLDRQPLLAALAVFGTGTVSAFNWVIAFAASLAAFLVTSLVCHRELYLRRPAAGRLTEFYLWMSFGGVLGGIFSALLAPQLFTSVFEFPLLVVAGLLARPVVIEALGDRDARREALTVVAVGLGVLAFAGLLINSGLVPGHPKLRLGIIAVLIGAMVMVRAKPMREMAVVGLMLLTVALLPEGAGASHAVRSFFGVHRVVVSPDGQMKLLMHGTTVHGAERKIDADGRPVERPVPATYYHPAGPMAKSVSLAQPADGRAPRIGVVGLGAGSMACHAKPEETWRFYEIDQAVTDLARDASQFGFLSKCRPGADIVMGDARLTLASEGSQSFDHLIIDAFSSDAIPAHLLTIEAMRLYFDKLTPDGVLVIHVSNRHLDLKPVVTANAAALQGVTTVLVDDMPANPGYDAAPSEVVVMSRNRERLEAVLAWNGARLAAAPSVRPWTDDYADVLSALIRGISR